MYGNGAAGHGMDDDHGGQNGRATLACAHVGDRSPKRRRSPASSRASFRQPAYADAGQRAGLTCHPVSNRPVPDQVGVGETAEHDRTSAQSRAAAEVRATHPSPTRSSARRSPATGRVDACAEGRWAGGLLPLGAACVVPRRTSLAPCLSPQLSRTIGPDIDSGVAGVACPPASARVLVVRSLARR